MKSKSFLLTVAFATLLPSLPGHIIAGEPAHDSASATVLNTEALERLRAGNKRFVDSLLEHPHQDAGQRTKLATSQHPFAVVLGCADSRTSPEVLFDQGLGDLFVVRVAGNVLNDETIGSIEYALEHLGAKLIVVLGHERCGAVKAAKAAVAANEEAHGHVKSLVTALKPAVEATKTLDAEATAHANERRVAEALKQSEPVIKGMVDKGDVTVLRAHYDLDTGVVAFNPDAPEDNAKTQ